MLTSVQSGDAQPLGKQARKSADTRNRLLRAAVICLYEQGYHRTSTNDVVAQAGSSRGALLYHFPNRSELFRATARYLVDGWLKGFASGPGLAASETLRIESGIKLISHLVTQPEFYAFLELTIASRTDDELRVELHRLRNRFIEATETASRTMFPEVVVTSPDYHREFLAFIHYLEGIALSQMVTQDPHDIEDSLRLWLTFRARIREQGHHKIHATHKNSLHPTHRRR